MSTDKDDTPESPETKVDKPDKPPKDVKPKSSKKSAPAKKAAAKKASTKKVVPLPRPKEVILRNKMFQLLVLEIRGKDGKLTSLQIPARSTCVWPKLDDYGADVTIKLRRKYLQIQDR